jgi:hypothetical protein
MTHDTRLGLGLPLPTLLLPTGSFTNRASSDTSGLHRLLLYALARGSDLADQARTPGSGIIWDKVLRMTK